MGSITFKLKNGGNVYNVNIKDQKQAAEDGEKKILYADINICGIADGSVMADLLGCEPKEVVHFWTANAKNDAIYGGIEKISSIFEGSGHTVKLSNKTFKNATVRKFHVKPIEGMKAEVYFQIHIIDVSDSDVEKIARMLTVDSVACSVDGPGDLLKS